MGKDSVLVSLGISAVSMGTTCAFFINLCNALYRCGCHSLWAGADRACNIHTAGVRHCPWCSHGSTGYGTVLALVLIPQLLVCWLPRRWNWRVRLAVALFVFPVAGSLTAIVMGLADGYWA